jgi:hypothetical protein
VIVSRQQQKFAKLENLREGFLREKRGVRDVPKL